MMNLGSTLAKGAAWMVLARVTDRTIGLVSMIVLARLLVPSDFGLVVLATAMIGVLQLLGAFSFDLALIQKIDAERRHYDTVWTLGLIFSALLASMLLLLAAPAARFYSEPRLTGVICVLGVGVLIEGFTNVGVVAFRKDMEFEKEYRFLLAKRLASVCTTLTCAALWRNHWALVAGIVASTAAGVFLSYRWQSYRPRFSLAAWRELFSFSRWLLINNALGFFYHRAADFILAKAVGATGLGHFSVAYEISNLPTSELVAPVNRALFPGYARMSRDIATLRQGFLNVVSVLGLITIPAAVGLACVAHPLVMLLLGTNWLSAVPLIQVLALNGLLSAMLSVSGYIYIAKGKPRHVTYVLGAHASLAVPLTIWAAFHYGTAGVAWMLLCASILVSGLNYRLLAIAIHIKASDLMSRLWRPLLGTAAMAGVVVWSEPLLIWQTSILANAVRLLLLVVYGGVAYCTVVTVLWILALRPNGGEAIIIQKVRALLWAPASAL